MKSQVCKNLAFFIAKNFIKLALNEIFGNKKEGLWNEVKQHLLFILTMTRR
jgi:hypothetical protein